MKNKVIIAIIILIIIVGIVIFLVLNNNKENDNLKEEVVLSTTPTPTNKEETMDYLEEAKKQMAMPNEGDTIAVIHVKNFGDITVKFFGDVAPKAVENFVTHSKEGYYNGVTFHRVINEFMIQGGDPLGNGTGGESIWGQGFEEELSEKIVPYRGALCMASRGLGNVSLGSQFFIVQANASASMASTLKRYGYPEELLNAYKEYGGYLSLYLQYTVFGQVIEGMEVVDKIANVETNSNDKPINDVVIESIEIKEYKK